MIETGTFLQERYRIDKQIGQGGMGAVYVATDERFGSVVAIKETLCMDDNYRKAIEREARLLNSLKHVALPRVSDHFEEKNGQFLVMEYIPGEDLCCILEDEGKPFDVATVLDWADQLLDALDFLHNQDMPVIHRDIKPQNLKLTPRNQIILLDFGLAKGNPTDAGHQTAAKSIFGYSRNYASLEQIQGTGTDPRSDLYSLAATLYHLLTGVAPEDALTRAMSVLSQKPDPLIPANNIRDEVPRGVAGVLHCALALNADDRPATASEMRQMLSEYEKYEDLADAVTAAAYAGSTSVHAQKTRLMGDDTHAGGAALTDVQTEVLPSDLSQVTAVRGTGAMARKSSIPADLHAATTTAAAPRRRPFAIGTALIGMLLAGVAIGGGIWMFKPSLLGVEPQDTTTGGPEAAPIVANTVNSADVSSADTLQDNSNIGDVAGTTGQSSNNPAHPSEPQPNERAKAPEQAQKPKNNANADEKTTFSVNDDDGSNVRFLENKKTGEVTIVTTSPDGKVTRNVFKQGSIPPMPPKRPTVGAPFPEEFQFRDLTPAQREKFRDAMRRARDAQSNVNRP